MQYKVAQTKKLVNKKQAEILVGPNSRKAALKISRGLDFLFQGL